MAEEVEVTLEEVLQEDASLVETADAVLGEASATHCSFPDGYVRQALYSCLTCKTAEPAGLCLACSLTCHADHDLVELYTKRHFRCDCGNDKFAGSDTPCQLYEGKDRLNNENGYSQNFKGLYCSCHRPYPDPERTTPEVMIQCIICEDWFHEEHLYADDTPVPSEFDEMICGTCMGSHAFLYEYVNFDASKSSDDKTCLLSADETKTAPSPLTPTFWMQGWRETLCKCDACMDRYESLKCEFLLDESDSLLAYEAAAREKQEDMAAAGEKAFKRELTHEQQVEMAQGYQHMASALKEYLSGFASSGQTVKAEDIQGFFENLKASKRQKRE
ncbi:hypothetical protein LEN26_014794 [Aphanomyces euteiches]|nr:hypothetical protein LEN26_014794 [Aphanomyces euteiches]KAH9124245.1 hypothetical protein AeMF1_004948 [Aphanomyces euteiches]KAH9193055.1 hypothetical protein AeNC1_004968 [Aphanomyces euteiches]